MFYNTVNESKEVADTYEKKCNSQEASIYALFKQKVSSTASDMHEAYGNSKTPLTSIRRAISNLVKKGLLIKTDKVKKGIYGRSESIYKII